MSKENMLTPGKVLKHYRERKGLALVEVSEATKIPIEQLKVIETDDYGDKESQVFYRGFVRNYSDFLDLDTDKILAIYRRTTALQENEEKVKESSHEQKKTEKQKSIEKVNSSTVNKVDRRSIKDEIPESDNKFAVIFADLKKKVKKIKLTPALVATIAVTLLILGVITYLIVQVYKFQQAPELIVSQPEAELTTNDDSVKVKGKVELPAVVEINGDVITVEQDGSFTVDINLVEGINTITAKAYKGNNEDNSTVITRNIVYNKPELEDASEDTINDTSDLETEESNEPEKPVEHTVYLETTEDVWTKLVVDGVQKIAWNLPEGKTNEYVWTESMELSTGKPKSTKVFIDGEEVEFVISSQGTGKVDCEVVDDGLSCL